MLSILIPIFNYDSRPLVQELHRQGVEGGFVFEICCFDDGSTDEFKQINQELSAMDSVRYVELPENLGRSRIRNQLAAAAQYPYLLFMDCDSKVVRFNYLMEYVDRLEPNTLLYGGRSYQEAMPSEAKYRLHWTYGTQREAQTADQRQQQAYHSFMTNNFLVPNLIFDSIKFDESLLQYGHEDTLFGLELEKKGIPILHFDNPLEHEGLESSTIFMEKTIKALENLVVLTKNNKRIETRLLRVYNKIQPFGLPYIIRFTYPLFAKSIANNLNSSSPSLFLFDLFKLAQLAIIKKRMTDTSD